MFFLMCVPTFETLEFALWLILLGRGWSLCWGSHWVPCGFIFPISAEWRAGPLRSNVLWKQLGRLEEKNTELETAIFKHTRGSGLLRDDFDKPAIQKHIFVFSCLLLGFMHA